MNDKERNLVLINDVLYPDPVDSEPGVYNPIKSMKSLELISHVFRQDPITGEIVEIKKYI